MAETATSTRTTQQTVQNPGYQNGAAQEPGRSETHLYQVRDPHPGQASTSGRALKGAAIGTLLVVLAGLSWSSEGLFFKEILTAGAVIGLLALVRWTGNQSTKHQS